MSRDMLLRLLVPLVGLVIVGIPFYRLRAHALPYRALMSLGILGLVLTVISLLRAEQTPLYILATSFTLGFAALADWLASRK